MDVPTNIKLIWNNSSPHSEEKQETPRWPLEGQRLDLVNSVHFSDQLKLTQILFKPAKFDKEYTARSFSLISFQF